MLIRIITALILAAMFIGLIVLLPISLFAEIAMLVMLLGLFEWDTLTTRSNTGFALWALLVLVAGVLIYLVSQGIFFAPVPGLLTGVVVLGALFWLWQATTLRKGLFFKRSPKVEMACGALAALFCWAGFTWLRYADPDGIRVVLLALTVMSAVDIFALFTGVTLGRHKLAPTISPGKTIEGAVGGLIGALLVAWAGGVWFLGLSGSALASWLVAALVASLLSMAGDLYVSRLKRHAGVKDSGRMLPGHGGVLDRIDAILAGAPVFAATWWLVQ